MVAGSTQGLILEKFCGLLMERGASCPKVDWPCGYCIWKKTAAYFSLFYF